MLITLTRVASVFFIKTIYSIILTIACAICNIPFPFIPIQITLIDFAIEAWPSFLTLLEPQTQKIKGQFLTNSIKKYISSCLWCLIMFFYLFIQVDHIPYSYGTKCHNDVFGTCMYEYAGCHRFKFPNDEITFICLCNYGFRIYFGYPFIPSIITHHNAYIFSNHSHNHYYLHWIAL